MNGASYCSIKASRELSIISRFNFEFPTRVRFQPRTGEHLHDL